VGEIPAVGTRKESFFCGGILLNLGRSNDIESMIHMQTPARMLTFVFRTVNSSLL
jgi:hypothetical protein